jgi:hypothetical protein
MNKSAKTLEFKFERTISAPPNEVFDGWLKPKIPGKAQRRAVLKTKFIVLRKAA